MDGMGIPFMTRQLTPTHLSPFDFLKRVSNLTTIQDFLWYKRGDEKPPSFQSIEALHKKNEGEGLIVFILY